VLDRLNPPRLLFVELDHLAAPPAFLTHCRRRDVQRCLLVHIEPAQEAPTFETGMPSWRVIAPAHALPPQFGDRCDPLG